MALPSSFAKTGFITPQQASRTVKGRTYKFRRLMVGTEGETDSGKTEFMLSAPGPGLIVAIDRNFDATLDNPFPPASRGGDFGIQVVAPLLATQSLKKEVYQEYWNEFYKIYLSALDNQDARTVGLDCDSDTWELQRLAEWGTINPTSGAVGLTWYGPKAARRAMIARAWDSGKIIIAANKLTDEYARVTNDNGDPVKDDKGKVLREATGNRTRQGFDDTDYLWQIQLRHLYKPAKYNPITKKDMPQNWGIRLLKVKANKSLEGAELWGEQCCFRGLVEFVYPQVPMSEWGF